LRDLSKVREFSFNEPHQLDAGTYMKPDKTTLADFLATWLVDYAKVKLSPRGFERYGDIVKQHLIPDFGEISLIKLKPEST